MWFTARITAYDCLSEVVVTAQVQADQGDGGPLTEVLRISCSVRGTGEDLPHDWLRDALVALAESL